MGPPLLDVDCHPLPVFATADLDAVRAAFRNAAPIALAQSWLDSPEPDFAPAIVRTGWRHDTLFVFAELTDADIHTAAVRHNDRFWELGDTFEMFLQPQPGQAYVELHVTPGNHRLQLRFEHPPESGLRTAGDAFAEALIHADVFGSRTWVDHAAGEWCVLAEVPASVEASGTRLARAASTARFSFCRYDFTRGRARPVISSSSPHPQPRFHRPDEWGTLRFRAGPRG